MAKRGRSSSSSSRNVRKIFNRAYDKCAQLRAGQTVKLSPLEEKVLSEALRRDYEKRKEAKRRMRERNMFFANKSR